MNERFIIVRESVNECFPLIEVARCRDVSTTAVRFAASSV